MSHLGASGDMMSHLDRSGKDAKRQTGVPGRQ